MGMHRITSLPYQSASFGNRLSLEMIAASIWPFQRDDRISLLMTALAAEMLPLLENDDQIEAVLDQLRIQLKLARWRNTL